MRLSIYFTLWVGLCAAGCAVPPNADPVYPRATIDECSDAGSDAIPELEVAAIAAAKKGAGSCNGNHHAIQVFARRGL